MARTVRLRQEWTLGQRIGDPSGFGEVFAATAADGTDGVVKLIAKRRGASRELFEELAGVPNVVPIIDSGETTGAWVIAMPRADRSLRAELEGAGGRLAVDAALSVLIDIASALEALDGRVP
jgi:hypothetical protein